jgi:hypothetical protein
MSSCRQPTRRELPVWELGVALTTLRHKNKLVTKFSKEPLTWTDSLNKRPKRRNIDKKFGTWNDLDDIGCGGVYGIDLAEDKGKWREIVNAVMNLQVP